MNANSPLSELLELLKEARQYAEYFGELGVERVEVAASGEAESPTFASTPLSAKASAQPKARATSGLSAALPQVEQFQSAKPAPAGNIEQMFQTSLFGEVPLPQQALPQSNETLEDIWRDIGDCTRCGLCEGRTQVVNTFGNAKARLMFIGEAPGVDEDAQGKPFVGRAGQLLTKIIEAIGLKREDVLIGNVNRCRPPGNRQPTLEEAAICRPFLFREIAAVQPDVIVVLGNTALRNLLETREGISRVRGQFQDFHGIKVMPTFHPAYLLRDPSKKRETWEDLKKVRDYLDSLPSKS
jgi:uracil-DNA glycosylase